jgi:hypothetical protein
MPGDRLKREALNTPKPLSMEEFQELAVGDEFWLVQEDPTQYTPSPDGREYYLSGNTMHLIMRYRSFGGKDINRSNKNLWTNSRDYAHGVCKTPSF